MYTFEFRDGRFVTNWQFFLFKEFTDIWNYDKTVDKDAANKLLYFVFLIADITDENPLLDETKNRWTEAKFRAFNDSHKEFTDKQSKLIDAAIKRYIELNNTPEERLLTAFDNMANRLAHVVDTTTPETVTNVDNGVVSYASNSKIIASSLSKLSKLRSNREKIISLIKKEAITQRIRGQLKLSPLIRGLITLDLTEEEYDDE